MDGYPAVRRVFVTGATGFIGRHCVLQLLERGIEVHGIFHNRLPAIKGVTWHELDLLGAVDMHALFDRIQPSHLLHLAWYAVPGKYWRSLDNLEWVRASLHMLRAFSECGGERVVAAGTCAEYDWNYGYCSEAVTPLAPSTMYGKSKRALGLMLGALTEETGLSSAWGRVFFLYGPGEHESKLVTSISRSLLNGLETKCTHGHQIRDFLHVADAASAFIGLLESGTTGSFNIASGKPVSVREVIFTVADQIGCPTDLVKFGGADSVDSAPPFLVADVTKITQDIGWRPRFNLRDGVKGMIDELRVSGQGTSS